MEDNNRFQERCWVTPVTIPKNKFRTENTYQEDQKYLRVDYLNESRISRNNEVNRNGFSKTQQQDDRWNIMSDKNSIDKSHENFKSNDKEDYNEIKE